MTTTSADVNFIPQVANDHIAASFERKMGIARLAVEDRTLTAAPGETVIFPYFKQIGAVQEPAENEALDVDRLVDDKFSVTVKETGKAVGWTDKSRRVSGAGKNPADVKANTRGEALRQMGIRFAEHVDKDIINVIKDPVNHKVGYTAAAAADKFTIGSLLDLKIGAFGDKQDQAIALAIHSLHFATMMKDNNAGFLKADATHPMYGAPGYAGMLPLGQALFVLDTMPEAAPVGGKKVFGAFTFKADPFGIAWAQDFAPEEDRDILMRESIIAGTMWYGVLGLHGKVADHDLRIGYGTFATEVNA